MSTRQRHTAEFDYPGMLFPESITRTITEPTLEAALAAAPDGDPAESWFGAKDGWYAVTVYTVTKKRFVADDGEETWVPLGKPERVLRAVVGEKVHVDEIEDPERNRILRSNIRINSQDGYGVHTRAGNWQIASDYDRVLSAAEAGAAVR